MYPRRKLRLCLLFILIAQHVFSQAVKLPSVPDLINWKEDNSLMDKANVKECREFEINRTGRAMTALFLYDKEGYLTEEKNYRSGVEIKKCIYEYSSSHHALTNYVVIYNGKKSISQRKKCDDNGYPLEVMSEAPDGSYIIDTKMSHFYNSKNLVDSSHGNASQFKFKWYYFYDNSGKIIGAKNLTAFYENLNWKFNYDSTGNLVNEIYWEIKRKTKDSIAIYGCNWTLNKEGKLLNQKREGRGWKEVDYDYKGDSITVHLIQSPELGPSEKHVIYISPKDATITRMRSFNGEGILENDKWYEYVYY